jgi:hypothetical protein
LLHNTWKNQVFYRKRWMESDNLRQSTSGARSKPCYRGDTSLENRVFQGIQPAI